MSLFTLSWGKKKKKKQRPILKPIKHFTPTLWQCAAWLLFRIRDLRILVEKDLFLYRLMH